MGPARSRHGLQWGIASMATLFISDLHLKPEAPALAATLLAFLDGEGRSASALYVLGDLFDAWPGDDDAGDPFNAPIVAAFRALTDAGVPLYFQHGNRDFLLGDAFARATGGTLLTEEVVVDLDGTPTLLMHGDQLCTDDLAYQEFRAQVRNPGWQRALLARPLAARKQLARQLRETSDTAKVGKSMDIMDVNGGAVAAAFRRHGVARMIHGHTHRPARHAHQVDGRACERIVLADWRDTGHVLAVGATGIEDRVLRP
jgi:UDP-2,3-diacylglucosamine hydrolase